MGKVGPKAKELTRREQRRLWREQSKLNAASDPSSGQTTVLGRSQHGKKAGGRRKPPPASEMMSPTKLNRVKGGPLRKKTKKKDGLGSASSSSSDLRTVTGLNSLFDELKNIFGGIGSMENNVTADMDEIHNNLESRFPTAFITPPNSYSNLGELGVTGNSSGTNLVPTLSASSSSDYEGSLKSPVHIQEDPFTTRSSCLIKDLSKSLEPCVSLPRHAPFKICETMAPPHTPVYREFLYLATPPDTHIKKRTVTTAGTTQCQNSDVYLESIDTRNESAAFTSNNSPMLLEEIMPRRVPTKVYTPEGLARAQSAILDAIARRDSEATASPSVKPHRPNVKRPSNHRHANAIFTKPRLTSESRLAKHEENEIAAAPRSARDIPINASDLKVYAAAAVSLPLNKPIDYMRAPVPQKMAVISSSAPEAEIKIPEAAPTLTMPRISRISTSTPKIDAGVHDVQPVISISSSAVTGDVGISTAAGIPKDATSGELPCKIPIPYLLPIPGHSIPIKPAKPFAPSTCAPTPPVDLAVTTIAHSVSSVICETSNLTVDPPAIPVKRPAVAVSATNATPVTPPKRPIMGAQAREAPTKVTKAATATSPPQSRTPTPLRYRTVKYVPNFPSAIPSSSTTPARTPLLPIGVSPGTPVRRKTPFTPRTAPPSLYRVSSSASSGSSTAANEIVAHPGTPVSKTPLVETVEIPNDEGSPESKRLRHLGFFFKKRWSAGDDRIHYTAEEKVDTSRAGVGDDTAKVEMKHPKRNPFGSLVSSMKS